MAKKKQRATQTSSGKNCQKRTAIQKAQRIAYKLSGERVSNQWAAYRQNKNVMLTIPNPDTANTKERFIRVPAQEVWRR